MSPVTIGSHRTCKIFLTFVKGSLCFYRVFPGSFWLPGNFGIPGIPRGPMPPGTPGVGGVPGTLGAFGTPGAPGTSSKGAPGVRALLASTGHVMLKCRGAYVIFALTRLPPESASPLEPTSVPALFRFSAEEPSSSDILSILTVSSFSTSGGAMGERFGSLNSLCTWRVACSMILPRARASTPSQCFEMMRATGAFPVLNPGSSTSACISSAASRTARSTSGGPTRQSARTCVSPITWWLNTSVGRSGTPCGSRVEGSLGGENRDEGVDPRPFFPPFLRSLLLPRFPRLFAAFCLFPNPPGSLPRSDTPKGYHNHRLP